MLCAEIPSDSDSSRRPSAASQAPSDYSVPGAGTGSYDGAGAAVSPGSELSFRAGLGGGGGSRRRASHSGELAAAVTLLGVPSSRQRGDSLPGNSGQFATLLPQYSVNMSSGNIDDEQLYTLRNFQKKGSKVINRGDSVKSRSRTSLNSRKSR